MELIEVRETNSYGKLRYVPLNEAALKAAELLKQKTLSAENITDLKAMGYSVVVKATEGREL